MLVFSLMKLSKPFARFFPCRYTLVEKLLFCDVKTVTSYKQQYTVTNIRIQCVTVFV